MTELPIIKPFFPKWSQSRIDVSFAQRIIDRYGNFGRYCFFLPALVFVKKKIPVYGLPVFAGNLRLSFHLKTERLIRQKMIQEQPKLSERITGNLKKMLAANRSAQNLAAKRIAESEKQVLRMKEAEQKLVRREKVLLLLREAITGPKHLQQQYINHVRTAAGWDTARRLEEFYHRRSLFLFADPQRGFPENGQAKAWYMAEQTPQIMNLIREKVHVPASEDAREVRANIYGLMQNVLIRLRPKEDTEQVKKLKESIEERFVKQEKVICELKKTVTEYQELKPGQIGKLTKEIVKKMGQELHLEKLRRGAG